MLKALLAVAKDDVVRCKEDRLTWTLYDFCRSGGECFFATGRTQLVVLTLTVISLHNVILWLRRLYSGLTLECGSLVLTKVNSPGNSNILRLCLSMFWLTTDIGVQGVVSTILARPWHDPSLPAECRRTNSIHDPPVTIHGFLRSFPY